MVIVPKVPYSRSILCRLLFNPITLIKKLIKTLLGDKTKSPVSNMIRTSIDDDEYVRIANSLGFTKTQCVPYNPYHQVCQDGRYSNSWVLRWYRLHYRVMQLIGREPRLRVAKPFAFCLLLTATKD